MPLTVKDMLEAANVAVQRIDVAKARELIDQHRALVIDVREAPEVEKSGKIEGALHISRGMLEFRADPASPYHHPEMQRERPIILYCGSGGRSALSGKLLQEMGYQKVYNLGAYKDWVEAGGKIEKAIEPGM